MTDIAIIDKVLLLINKYLLTFGKFYAKLSLKSKICSQGDTMTNNQSKKQRLLPRFRIIIIIGGMLVVIAITIAAAIFLVPFSEEFASSETYAYLSFMRVPVLLMVESVIALFLVACILSIPLLAGIYKGRPFSSTSIRLLHLMKVCFFLMIAPLIALVIYTESHVTGSITNLYCILGMGIAFVIANIFGLFATLIERASEFEQEINLTI